MIKNKYILYTVSAIEGFVIMGAEIVGAKLLAPFFGNSLYVWSTVISITMLGLAAGYFFGAYRIKKDKNLLTTLRLVAFINAVWLPVLPFLVKRIYAFLMYHPVNFFLSLFGVAFMVLFTSVALLGLVSPIIIQLLNQSKQKAGVYAGTVFALSTFTGIVATLLFGFWIIPYFGLKISTLTLSIAHIIFFILLIKSDKKLWIAVLIWVVLMIGIIVKIQHKSTYVIYQQEGIDGQIAVYEYPTECFGKLRELTINQITQTLWAENGEYVLDYVNLIYNLTDTITVSDNENALVLGMGGGTLANMLAEKNYRVDAVEFDARIIDVARKFLFLDRSIQVFNDDARHFINQLEINNKKYALVIIDIFKGEVSPGYVLTIESLTLLKKHLTPNARIIINSHGYLDLETGKGNLALLHTLKQAGFNVSIHSTGNLPQYRNLLIFATQNAHLQPVSSVSFPHLALLLTDDKQQLEQLNAQANINWRKGYIAQLMKEHLKLNPGFFR